MTGESGAVTMICARALLLLVKGGHYLDGYVFRFGRRGYDLGGPLGGAAGMPDSPMPY
jgi:hypothetical protein